MANSILIILFSKMLKFSKIIFSNSKNNVKEKSEYLRIFHLLKWKFQNELIIRWTCVEIGQGTMVFDTLVPKLPKYYDKCTTLWQFEVPVTRTITWCWLRLAKGTAKQKPNTWCQLTEQFDRSRWVAIISLWPFAVSILVLWVRLGKSK